MKIEDYELLLKLNKIGTIRATAQVILISQPAVSQRLKFIEEYLNEKIFIRTAKKLILTPSGEIILSHAKKLIEQEQWLFNTLSKSSEHVQETLSIACSSIVSQRYLPSILADYTKLFPNVSIDLVTGISETIKRDHKNYHVSIIRGEQLKESTCELLFQDPLYIFDTEPFTEKSVKERALISFKSDGSMNELVDDWLYYHQHHIKPHKMIHVDQIETCKQFMMEGLGMAVLPKSVSASLMADYPHIPLRLNSEDAKRDTWICYEKGILKLPQVEEFIKLVRTKQYHFN